MNRNKKKSEWTRFKVGEPSERSNWTEPNCQPLMDVSHVSHINSALNIFECGKIKAGLVYDKSKLNTDRISVNWLSPNDWSGAGGFRYGNIRFNFEWTSLLNEMNIYWIESIAYGVDACRILLSQNDYSKKFQRYDPTLGDGPWWYDKKNDKHYWNGYHCLEIMIEKDLNITDVKKIDFVNHHSRYCNISPISCHDCGLYSGHAGARFIAALVGRGNQSNFSDFFESSPNKIDISLIKNCLSTIWDSLEIPSDSTGAIKSNQDIALPLARAILSSYAAENYEEQDILSSLFSSKKQIVNSCAKIISKTLNISNWKNIAPLNRKAGSKK